MFDSPRDHDLLEVGRASTSVSLALGLAKAHDLAGGTENVIAVIDDGSLSGGEALGALDVAGGELNSSLIIVFNDNQISIAENHGGISRRMVRHCPLPLREDRYVAPPFQSAHAMHLICIPRGVFPVGGLQNPIACAL